METLILEFVVRSVLIAICTAAALFVLRVKTARVRHCVWAAVVASMLILPVWSAWGPKAVFRVMAPPVVIAEAQPQNEALGQGTLSTALPRPDTSPWPNGFTIVYLSGLLVLLARLAVGTIRARRLTTDSCVAPITIGLINPKVILPVDWSQWSQEQVSAVLSHESEHVRWRDPLVQWIALLNRAVFWFHPLAWWLPRQLSALAEEACDDAVLTSGHDPIQYSGYLLELARIVRESGARVTAVGMAMPGAFLPRRIRRIVAGAPLQRISRWRVASLGMACAVVLTLFTAGAVGYYPQDIRVIPPASSNAQTQLVPAPIDLPVTVAARRPAKVLLAQAKADPVRSSASTTGISGTVLDPSDAVVPNVAVILTDTGTGAALTTTTDATGTYRFGPVGPGTYSMTVKVPGFKALTQTNISVSGGQALNIGQMHLQLGGVSESITITGSRSAPVTMAEHPGGTLSNGITTLGPMTSLAAPAPPATTFRFTDRQGDLLAGPIRVGGNVQPANLIDMVRPAYPLELQQLGVQGTVRIEAVISKTGELANLKVISQADPGLTQAALDAVRQWQLRPTMLNGQPVETLTTIDVNFQLKD